MLGCFAWMCACPARVCLVPVEFRRRNQVTWNWSYTDDCQPPCERGTQTRPSGRTASTSDGHRFCFPNDLLGSKPFTSWRLRAMEFLIFKIFFWDLLIFIVSIWVFCLYALHASQTIRFLGTRLTGGFELPCGLLGKEPSFQPISERFKLNP